MVNKKDPLTGDGAPLEPGADPTPTPIPADIVSTTADETPAAESTVAQAHERHAHTVIRNYVLLSAATAVIPIVFVDTAALAAVQLRLLKELSDIYGVSFRADIGKSAVGTLLGTIAPTLLSSGFLGSAAVSAVLRSVPVIGTVTQLATQPLFHAAFTYALGKVFQQHFASGGTFLTFDPEKVKTYFREKYAEARGRKGAVPDAVAA